MTKIDPFSSQILGTPTPKNSNNNNSPQFFNSNSIPSLLKKKTSIFKKANPILATSQVMGNPTPRKSNLFHRLKSEDKNSGFNSQILKGLYKPIYLDKLELDENI